MSRIAGIAEAVGLFIQPDQLTELRVLTPAGETFAGWFTGRQLPDLASAALGYEQRAKGIYFIPNSILPHDKPAAMSRRGAGGTTGDDMIGRRLYTLIDIDPVRRGLDGAVIEQTCPSTDAEREAAWQVLLRCKGGMEAFGFTGGIVGDSGNGWHLCYPIDLPNDDESRAQHKTLLAELEARCGDESAHVDLKTFNASRIWKLYGTHARKGTEADARRWRYSQIALRPDTPDTPGDRQANNTALERMLTTWRKQSAFRDRPKTASDPGTYARKALELELGKMVSAIPGTLNNTLFAAAAALGNFVGSRLLDRDEVEQKLAMAVLAAGGKDERKNLDTIRRGLAEGEKTPRAIPNATPNVAGATPNVAPDAAPLKPPLDEGVSCAALMALDLPEPRFAVPGLLPEGVVILAARPKSGKSWAALAIGLGVAQGAAVLGTLPTEKGDVLYLALEDTRRRLKKRVGKILEGTGWEAPHNMEFRVATERADKGGLLHIAAWLEAHPDARLVIVDTLAKFRPPGKSKSDSYSDDYDCISGLKALADRHACCILIVHHSRKAVAESPFDEVSGTLGLTGAADAIFVLQRTHSSASALLYVTGRDIEEETLTITWDAKTCLWRITGRQAGVNRPEPTENGNGKAASPRVAQCSVWVNAMLVQGAMRQSAIISEAENAKPEPFDKKLLYRTFDALKCVQYDDPLTGRKWVRLPDPEST